MSTTRKFLVPLHDLTFNHHPYHEATIIVHAAFDFTHIVSYSPLGIGDNFVSFDYLSVSFYIATLCENKKSLLDSVMNLGERYTHSVWMTSPGFPVICRLDITLITIHLNTKRVVIILPPTSVPRRHSLHQFQT